MLFRCFSNGLWKIFPFCFYFIFFRLLIFVVSPPFLFLHSARIEYTHGRGVRTHLQAYRDQSRFLYSLELQKEHRPVVSCLQVSCRFYSFSIFGFFSVLRWPCSIVSSHFCSPSPSLPPHTMRYRPEEEHADVYNAELNIAQRALKRNPKSYCAWHHRLWTVDLGKLDLNNELELCTKFLKMDARNCMSLSLSLSLFFFFSFSRSPSSSFSVPLLIASPSLYMCPARLLTPRSLSLPRHFPPHSPLLGLPRPDRQKTGLAVFCRRTRVHNGED